ncbi:MAG: DoxX family protein [Chthoniobacterales bacterium]
MKTLVPICQIIVGCGLLNVWLLRFNKSTAYRGRAAANMREEFAAYGLPAWSCYLVGFLKVASAFALLGGLLPVLSGLVLPAAMLVAVLMAGALAMHVKVGDPFKRAVPALSVLVLCALIIAGRWPAA